MKLSIFNDLVALIIFMVEYGLVRMYTLYGELDLPYEHDDAIRKFLAD